MIVAELLYQSVYLVVRMDVVVIFVRFIVVGGYVGLSVLMVVVFGGGDGDGCCKGGTFD